MSYPLPHLAERQESSGYRAGVGMNPLIPPLFLSHPQQAALEEELKCIYVTEYSKSSPILPTARVWGLLMIPALGSAEKPHNGSNSLSHGCVYNADGEALDCLGSQPVLLSPPGQEG